MEQALLKTFSIREYLKKNTQNSHSDLEANLESLVSPHLTKELYISILRGMYRFHRWVEDCVQKMPQGSAAARFYLEGRTKTKRIEFDLAYLKGAKTPNEPPMRNLPVIESESALWGVLYVVEGSTLGSQFISRNLNQLGILPHSGSLFFQGYGNQTGKMWQSFLQLLESSCTRLNPEDVLNGAETAFQAAILCFERISQARSASS